jgi:hypothetical protein
MTRTIRRIFAHALVMAATLCASTALGKPVLTTPTPLPEDRNPCAAFTADADYVAQTLIMQLEGREVSLRVPRQFFEDPWDFHSGFADTAQLFRVEIGTFTPVSRAETGRRNTRDVWNWMHVLISDQIPLERMAVLSAELASSVIGGDLGRSFETYVPVPGPFGLAEIRSDAPQPTPGFRTNAYAAQTQDGSLTAVLSCHVPGSVMNPVCEHWFRAAGMDVKLSYRRTELPNWQTLQDDVTAFLTCATRPGP